MERIAAWWRTRTPREQLILRGGAGVVFLIMLPAWAYLGAAEFRAESAARLASARQVEANVARLADAGRARAAVQIGDDPSLRGLVLGAAQGTSLVVARAESGGEGRERVVFEPANSLAVYRWIELIGSGGAHVARTSIVRVEDSDLVRSEFEITAAP